MARQGNCQPNPNSQDHPLGLSDRRSRLIALFLHRASDIPLALLSPRPSSLVPRPSSLYLSPMDPLLTSYEEVPYESTPIHDAHPDVISTTALLLGVDPPPVPT